LSVTIGGRSYSTVNWSISGIRRRSVSLRRTMPVLVLFAVVLMLVLEWTLRIGRVFGLEDV
jgi:hypothetical protein